MAGKLKFPLKMADGAAVRDPVELKEHFDLASILRYYDDGRLAVWLENCYYDDEARQIKALDPSDPDLKRKLCEILGIQSADVAEMNNGFRSITDMVKAESISDAREKNRRLNELRKYTDDDAILDAVDRVAFTQEELENLLAEGVQEIYLCGDQFTIPPETGRGAFPALRIYTLPPEQGCYTFIGVNHPTVDIAEKLDRAYMHFENVEFTAQTAFRLAEVSDDPEEAFLRYQEAAEKGLAEAQERLGYCYRYGKSVEKNIQKAAAWSLKAAMQGNARAQTRMGIFYENGDGVEKDLEKAVKWYQKAAEQGQSTAQYRLGRCYQRGLGTERDEKEAVKWLQKAADSGVAEAVQELAKLIPTRFRLSEVVLCAIGGKENMNCAELDRSTRMIGIAVKDRHKIDKTVLEKYGASAIQTQSVYYYPSEKVPLEKALGVAVRRYFSLWAGDGKKRRPLFGKDLGWGFLHFRLETITPEMLEDFNLHIKKDPDTPA